ncbi:MAG: hypothetical protein A2Z20_09145 [Bdellovibrionales bacterium RBG_16_40_8]|nr:MAG: hypothetical protein A2Z20_09145 [Bdellovibrionales bacterium RBG_16_40_8]
MRYVPQILVREIVFESTRSRGPGGQHVNRASTAMVLRWNVFSTNSFLNKEKEILLKKLSSKITGSGEVVIRSEEFRSQSANRKRCLEKFETLLQSVLYRPKKKKKTKPTQSSVESRHSEKRRRALTKKLREKVYID